MAKKDRKKAREEQPKPKLNPLSNLQDSTKESVWGIVLFVLCLFFILAAFGMGGSGGYFIYDKFGYLLGIGYYLIPTLLLILSASFFGDRNRSFSLSKSIGSILFIFSGLGLFDLISMNSGGILGRFIAYPLVRLFDTPISFIFLIAGVLISVLIILDTTLKREHILFWQRKKNTAENEAVDNLSAKALGLTEDEKKKLGKDLGSIGDADGASGEKDNSGDDSKRTNVLNPLKDKNGNMAQNKAPGAEGSDGFIPLFAKKTALLGKKYVPPPLSILENDKGKPGVGDIKANANIIKRTLQNFGIDVEMDEVSIGPSVTRYALKPAEGVKLSKILGLQNNLSLALAAHPIRIEAPIPGKSLVGIEIPNTVKTTVGLGTMLAQEDFQKSSLPLMVALGKGISGKSYFSNLAKMPHLLLAGATGSGKSVTAHAIISSLLYRNSPENLRFIMIDPKRVELTLYNGIPHLLTPVITDAKKAIMALRWAAKEMDRRYDILEKNSVRDIDSYHKNILVPTLERNKSELKINEGGDEAESAKEEVIDAMPYIVIMIDELADIMQAYPRELEAGIVRLAQMSRAVGIHLILSTQRPSVNVITGLIKANVPARIALQVASQIDSRTILDMRGAEELLGAGDMLWLNSDMSSPLRLQSAFLTEPEIKKIVKHLKDNADSLTTDQLILAGGGATAGDSAVNDPIFNASGANGLGGGLGGGSNSSFRGGDDDDADDDLYNEAKDIVMKAGKASTSYIQRKLRVGYARAARLMDILEDKGVIGPADGSKPREVIGYSGNQVEDASAEDIHGNEPSENA
jgi:S-DNA-T family DNA segregation ATPase FtsK/SpoIIIE